MSYGKVCPTAGGEGKYCPLLAKNLLIPLYPFTPFGKPCVIINLMQKI